MTKLVWFRSDLRTVDNPALYHAVQLALQQQQGKPSGGHAPPPVLATYILSPSDWKAHSLAPCKVEFILRNLQNLSDRLWARYRIPLLIRTASTKDKVLEELDALVKQHHVSALYLNAEYEVNEGRRDKRVIDHYEKTKSTTATTKIHRFDDQCVVLPGLLRSKNGEGNVYTVYTPFKKSWYRHVFENGAECLRIWNVDTGLLEPAKLTTVNAKDFSAVKPDPIPTKVEGYDLKGMSEDYRKTLHQLFPAGEEAAQKRLEAFAASRAISDYDDQRNFMANEKGTSGLSAYLASGVITAKVCVKKALSLNSGKMDSGNKGW